ncbi:hypothetical protein [Synoicihabitans lomoniglobus]|uniref:Uncharacterized protein n=1 Tax=Synoicihabitans lomoniglobus TaxID=2909285 RepID=A0AAF0CRB1_9BACT|nr:hypothetical protein [Opitutaceae bacterium LMO-M01]WED66647.1 hypothetical protein PXH66_07260 [Opitutaceae bacterium LMO-M01]
MPVRFLVATIIGLSLSAGGQAQETSGGADASAVEIAQVRFTTVRDNSGGAWWRAEVEVRVNASGSGRARFADRVRVDLSLATEVTAAEEGFEFYRAGATAVALESGRWMYRFYLPPAIVRRDRLQGTPRFWLVDATVAGEAVPPSRQSVGPGFSNAAALQNFRSKLAQRAPSNDGVLRPEFLTLFANPADEEAPVMLLPAAFTSEP